jgi:16S rRNA G1207 methylase RsmC
LFSPSEIDEGTRLLIDNMEISPADMVLDLGCGYGAIGVVAASLAPQGHIHMVDKDFIAVQYAQENAELNYLKNTESYLSNGFSHISEGRTFHKILSNLPAKVGKEMLAIFVADAKKHLKIGGKIFVVTVMGLKNPVKYLFEEEFGNYEKVASGKNYIVASATKV